MKRTKRHWLWLEDQQETVADFRYQIEAKISVESFRRPNDLMNELSKRQKENRLQTEPLGFLLDVMLINNPTITVPGSWHGGEKLAYFPTQRNGYDAGVVFCEKVLLSHQGMEKPPIFPPPPVVFLTVVDENFQGLEGRLAGIRARWAAGSPKSDSSTVKVAWIQKWNAQGLKLVDLVTGWDQAEL